MNSAWDGETPTPDEIAYVRARYDENAVYADHLLGRLLDTIRAAGQYDNTLIVFLADHGEAFWEHGRFLHSANVYEENVHVPFVVKWPARVRGFTRVVAEPVSLLDLVPTLVDGLGVTAEGAVFHGRTVLPLAFGAPPVARELYVSRRPLREAHQVYGMRAGRYKVIYNAREDKTEFYDLASDKGELVDLAEKEPLRMRAFLQRLLLQRHRNLLALANSGGKERDPLDADTLRALRALGYLQQ
jgi:arylsulfatase A-like enzyme